MTNSLDAIITSACGEEGVENLGLNASPERLLILRACNRESQNRPGDIREVTI